MTSLHEKVEEREKEYENEKRLLAEATQEQHSLERKIKSQEEKLMELNEYVNIYLI
jgi:septal ring factor EnvC (AmiA/AmiB activator)